ncbi:nucleotidyltransferase family protein, partial [Vibrio campbellii]
MLEDKLAQLLAKDPIRVQALQCVRSLDLPDCYIAAGFVRNLVWDHLHQKHNPTPLN